MPRRPEAARLRPSRVFAHSPPFLNSLTRSTLPTSSVSPQLPVTRVYNLPPEPIRHSPGIILSQSYPSCSSLDSLRSIHTSSLQSFPTTSSWQWWFQQKASSPPPSPHELDKQCSLLSFSHVFGFNTYSIDLSPSNPVVFCHGLLGFDSVTIGPAIAPLEVSHWRGIKEVLEQNGTQVLITRVPATSSPVDRAKVLEQKISAAFPGRSVHLIGKSLSSKY